MSEIAASVVDIPNDLAGFPTLEQGKLLVMLVRILVMVAATNLVQRVILLASSPTVIEAEVVDSLKFVVLFG